MGVTTMKVRMRMLMLGVAALGCSFFLAGPVQASTSIIVDEPGFYGRLDLGGYPSPRLLYPEAVIIDRVGAPPPPAYLRVPPGHAKKWAKHCHRYNACGQPVYFVDDDWYQNVYVPRYREIHGKTDPMRVQPRPVAGEMREVKVKEERRAMKQNSPRQEVRVKEVRNKSGNSGNGGKGNNGKNVKAGKADKANKGNPGQGNPGQGNPGKGNSGKGNGKGPNK